MKKLFAMILAAAMCLSLCVPAFATDTDTIGEKVITNEQHYNLLYNSVYEQLDEQNALDMLDDYMTILAPNHSVGEPIVRGDDDEIPNIRAPYGGSVQYVYTEGYETREVSVECMDYDNTYHYILSSSASISAEDILFDLLGYVPYLSIALSLAQKINLVCNQAAYNSIAAANGYGQIVSIYNRTTQASSSVLTGWYSHPWIYVNVNNPQNVNFTLFPQHNPFD